MAARAEMGAAKVWGGPHQPPGGRIPMIVLRSPRRRRRAGRRRVLLLFFGTYAEEPAAVVDGAKGVVGGRVQRVHRVHRLLFEHAERAPAVHPARVLNTYHTSVKKRYSR